MLDVHPPHAAAHTWRDFFIHIATIVIGLLIAIGLEQSVEYLHHRHQLRELREAIQQDDEKALRDDEDVVRWSAAQVAWLTARIDDVTVAIRTNAHAHSIPMHTPPIRSIPIDPAWKAANTSGLANIMPQEDVKVFSELDILIAGLNDNFHDHAATSRRMAFEQRFRVSSADQRLDFASATRAELIEYLTLLSEELSHAKAEYDWTLYLRGALQQIIGGERNLDRIDDAEDAEVDKASRAPVR